MNNHLSNLDQSQIQQRIYDESNDALRVDIITDLATEIQLRAEDGDSVVAQSLVLSKKPVTGEIFSIVGFKYFQLIAQKHDTVLLEISPHDSDDFFIPVLGLAVIDVKSEVITIIARRARVIFTSGDVYLNASN